jgi:hypothetical protein
VHAELTLGLGITIGHGAVELLMHRAGIKGLPGNRRPRPKQQTPTADDRAAQPAAMENQDRAGQRPAEVMRRARA